MTWPSAQTKVNFDEGTDDPKAARAEFASNVDKFNTLIGHFSSLAQTFVADTTAGAMRTTIDAQQLINSLTAETSPAVADTLGFYDDSAGAHRKITFANWLKVINALSADSSPDGAADYVVTYDASAGAAKRVLLNNLGAGITRGTAVSTTSGTTHTFTGLPAGVDEIKVMLSGVSTNGTSNFLVQIGDSGGIEATNYDSSFASATGNITGSATTGFVMWVSDAGEGRTGVMTLHRINGSNKWIATHQVGVDGDTAGTSHGQGTKTLSGTLDRIRLTTVNGTDVFDAGTLNILHQ